MASVGGFRTWACLWRSKASATDARAPPTRTVTTPNGFAKKWGCGVVEVDDYLPLVRMRTICTRGRQQQMGYAYCSRVDW